MALDLLHSWEEPAKKARTLVSNQKHVLKHLPASENIQQRGLSACAVPSVVRSVAGPGSRGETERVSNNNTSFR